MSEILNQFFERTMKQAYEVKSLSNGKALRAKIFTLEQFYQMYDPKSNQVFYFVEEMDKYIALRMQFVAVFYKYDFTCQICKAKADHLAYESLNDGKFFLKPYIIKKNFKKENSYIEVPLTADHVIPRVKGGANGQNNMQALCYYCNTQKGDKIII